MKKYLSTLVAVILAALSFTLASCGGDEDEPNGSGGQQSAVTSNFTVNDVKASFREAPCLNIQSTKEPCLLYASALLSVDDEWYDFSIYMYDEDIYEGAVLLSVGDDGMTDYRCEKMYFSPEPNYTSDFGNYGESGNVTITKVTAKSITITFNHYKLWLSVNRKTYELNGSITFPYDKNLTKVFDLTKFKDKKATLTENGESVVCGNPTDHHCWGSVENFGETTTFSMSYCREDWSGGNDTELRVPTSDVKPGSVLPLSVENVYFTAGVTSVSGNVKVVSVSSNEVVLEFNDFTVKNESLRYTLDGTVRYFY